jgi:hypothetical protein
MARPFRSRGGFAHRREQATANQVSLGSKESNDDAVPPAISPRIAHSRFGAAAAPLDGIRDTAKDRKRVRPDETVPLKLNDRERELILSHSFADQELTDRLRVVHTPDEPLIYRFALDDLEELAGYVAVEANHTQNKKQRKEWDKLFERISALDSYTGQDD